MIWFYGILLLSSLGIIYQDLKSRLISVWLVLGFAIANVAQYLYLYSTDTLIGNSLFCLLYSLLLYFVLLSYYFIRTGKIQSLLNDKIGWGDVCLLWITGCCLSPEETVFFFTGSFMIAALSYFMFSKPGSTIALGAILLICYDLLIAFKFFA